MTALDDVDRLRRAIRAGSIDRMATYSDGPWTPDESFLRTIRAVQESLAKQVDFPQMTRLLDRFNSGVYANLIESSDAARALAGSRSALEVFASQAALAQTPVDFTALQQAVAGAFERQQVSIDSSVFENLSAVLGSADRMTEILKNVQSPEYVREAFDEIVGDFDDEGDDNAGRGGDGDGGDSTTSDTNGEEPGRIDVVGHAVLPALRAEASVEVGPAKNRRSLSEMTHVPGSHANFATVLALLLYVGSIATTTPIAGLLVGSSAQGFYVLALVLTRMMRGPR